MVTAIKVLLVLLLLYILVNLALAGRAMVNSNQPMSRYLGRRVGFSVVVLLIIVVAAGLGWLPLNPRPY